MTQSSSSGPTPPRSAHMGPGALDTQASSSLPNSLDALWMGFTPSQSFKQRPRLVSRAQDMHYFDPTGRPILDTCAGLWCVNAGHARPKIVEAIQRQAQELDYAPTFQFAHPKVFELASRLAMLAPEGFTHAFFTNSGSESIDTALKMAIATHRLRGEGSRTRIIGRERGYHGVGFGGISAGGIVANRKWYGPLLPGSDHLPHTYDRAHQAYTIGQPAWGAHLADELERLIALHDASTIACVVVEPVAGSTGLLPPPIGYLERLREICTRHGILLIFDEVITGFGRLGAAFASERFGVTPDLITFAKGVTSGTVPLGGVLAPRHIHDTFLQGREHGIDFFHGYTYTGHPLAVAAALASLDVYQEEGLFERSRALEATFAQAVMSLKGHPALLDIRTIGLTAALDLVPLPDAPGRRGYLAMETAFHTHGLMLRITADTIAFSPPLIITEDHIEEIFTQKIPKILDEVLSFS